MLYSRSRLINLWQMLSERLKAIQAEIRANYARQKEAEVEVANWVLQLIIPPFSG